MEETGSLGVNTGSVREQQEVSPAFEAPPTADGSGDSWQNKSRRIRYPFPNTHFLFGGPVTPSVCQAAVGGGESATAVTDTGGKHVSKLFL